MKTVTARLDIEMIVNCPNDDCDYHIDLLDENDTDGTLHNEEGDLLEQMFPTNGSHDDFECEEVTCTECKTTFNVKGLEW
jgi:hypothetical protein